MNRKPRLILADSHRLFAEACKQVLEPEFDVVAIVADGRSFVETALNRRPDGVIIEVYLPQLNGLDAAEQIKRKLTSFKLIFATAHLTPNVVAEAFRRGASGYVLKQSGADDFLNAVRTVMSGGSYLSPLVARETIEHLLHPPTRALPPKHITRRESEVLQLLADGMRMKEVADVLGISAGTVAFHKYSMMEKLGIESNAGLLQYATSRYMTSPIIEFPGFYSRSIEERVDEQRTA